MSSARETIEHLLDALRQAGDPGKATALEDGFVARGWDVGLTDQLEVIEALQRVSAANLAEPGWQPRVVDVTAGPVPAEQRIAARTLSTPGPRFALLADFGPWVERLPNQWRIVEAVHRLLEVGDFDDLKQALWGVFIDCLGLERCDVNETARISSQTTIPKLSVVARHLDFVVLAAASNYAGPHLSSFDTLFALHPRALVFALERGRRVRVVTRQSTRTSKQMSSRVLHGIGKRSLPTDDLLIWSRRLAVLEPGPGDDALALARRADAMLNRSAREILCEWNSCSVDPTNIPGVDWQRSPIAEVVQFLQPNPTTTKLRFGLAAELHANFPWESSDGVRIDYVGYQVVEIADDVPRAMVFKADTRAVVDVEVIHRGRDGNSSPLTLRCSVLIPDCTGMFVVRGEHREFVPGRHDATGAVDLERLEDEQLELDEVEAEAREPEVSEEAEGSQVVELDPFENEEDADAEDYSDASLIPLLRWAVGRKLRWYARKLSHCRAGAVDTPNSFKAWILGRWADVHGMIGISSMAVLVRHLMRPTHPGIRVIQVDPNTAPPSWACLDLSAALRPGLAAPIAGARLGPGGVLTTPTTDKAGVVCLTVAPGLATQTNPRAGMDGNSGELSPAFIAPQLRRWAPTRVGALREPLAAMHGSTVVGPFPRVGGSELVLRCVAEGLQAHLQRSHWHIDVPTRGDDDEQPTVVVKVGDQVDPGTPLLEIAERSWPNDKASEEHVLVSLAVSIATSDWSRRPKRQIIAPPSLEGKLESVLLTELRDSNATLVGRRASFTTWSRLRPSRAVLPDGRTAPIMWVGSEDLPWRAESADIATALLVDPDYEEGEPNSDEDWFDGHTGELIESVGMIPEVTLLSQRGVGPDPALASRVLDGWGQPRAAMDPAISMSDLRWLQAASPSQAAAIHTVMNALHSTIAPGVTLIELARASHIATPRFLVDAVNSTERAPPLPPYDPTRSSSRSKPWSVGSNAGPRKWRCRCGVLTGLARVQERCRVCGEPVLCTLAAEAEHEIELPYPMIHPWRRSLVASLLGLTKSELDTIVANEQCSEFAELTAIALRRPLRSLRHRVESTPNESVRITLLQQMQELEPALKHGLVIEDLWLTRLRMLSPRLLFDGLRLGAPDLLESQLTKRYRRVLSLVNLSQGRIDGHPALKRFHWVELQRRIDDLFGAPTGRPEPGTLAELLHRTWPTTSPDSVPLAVSGMCANVTADELRQMSRIELWTSGAQRMRGSYRAARGLVGAQGLIEIGRFDCRLEDPADARAWRERGAWAQLAGNHLVELAAVFLSIDTDPLLAAGVRALLPIGVADLSEIGPELLQQLIRAIRPPSGRPSRLLGVLLGKSPVRLATEDEVAQRQLEVRLDDVVAADDFQGRIAMGALTHVLRGFWTGEPTSAHPTGWTWASSAAEAPAGYRRTIPRLTDSAWHRWPDFTLLTRPLAALRLGAVETASQAVLAWLGVASQRTPECVDWGTSPNAPTLPLLEPAVIVTQPTASANDVIVYPSTLSAWLGQSRR